MKTVKGSIQGVELVARVELTLKFYSHRNVFSNLQKSCGSPWVIASPLTALCPILFQDIRWSVVVSSFDMAKSRSPLHQLATMLSNHIPIHRMGHSITKLYDRSKHQTSYLSSLIILQNLMEPATLHRSPIFTKFVNGPICNGSKPRI